MNEQKNLTNTKLTAMKQTNSLVVFIAMMTNTCLFEITLEI